MADSCRSTQPPKELIDAVLPDEFPLSMFYEALEKKLRRVVESTRGHHGTDGDRLPPASRARGT